MGTKKYKLQMPLAAGHSSLLHDHGYQDASFHYSFFFQIETNSRKCHAPLLSGLDRSYFPVLIRFFFFLLVQSSNPNPTQKNQMCLSQALVCVHKHTWSIQADPQQN